MRGVGLAELGVVTFAGFVLFTLVTLPIEVDASRRARTVLAQSRIFAPDELEGIGRVLRAAAATYVAAALTAIMQLLYFAARVAGARPPAPVICLVRSLLSIAAHAS